MQNNIREPARESLLATRLIRAGRNVKDTSVRAVNAFRESRQEIYLGANLLSSLAIGAICMQGNYSEANAQAQEGLNMALGLFLAGGYALFSFSMYGEKRAQ